MAMTRRTFLTATAAAAVALGARPGNAFAIAPPTDPLGPLLGPDALGLRLPAGFTSRLIATSGQMVGRSGYVWHTFPDGGACFDTHDGGWIYVSNSELFGADDSGVGAIRFDHRGRILDAYPILRGSSRNCAGGTTPWETWLSGEERDGGKIWECDPTGRRPAIDRPALGRFIHEAAAVDETRGHVYLTEDAADGRLYRFKPHRRGDLSSGTLAAARVIDDRVTWIQIPDPSAAVTPTRHQVPETTPFAGGEGIWWVDGAITFVTKRDHKLWRLDTRTRRIEIFYDALSDMSNGVLGEPDNITITHHGHVYVSEDQSDDQQVVLIDRRGWASPVVQLVGSAGSEVTGLAFNPRGNRMYISSQRGSVGGTGPGVTFEISGPFPGRGYRHGHAGHGDHGHGGHGSHAGGRPSGRD